MNIVKGAAHRNIMFRCAAPMLQINKFSLFDLFTFLAGRSDGQLRVVA
jgi:hypothetical protein